MISPIHHRTLIMEPTHRNAGNLFIAHVGSGRPVYIDLAGPASPIEMSFDALDGACNAIARGLQQRGLGEGDRVAILSSNRGEYVATLFGAMRAGCVPVPVNLRLTWQTIRSTLFDSAARLVFADGGLVDKVRDEFPTVDYDGRNEGGFASFCNPGSFAAAPSGRNAVAIQPYTSGSTGTPKGVCLGHAGIWWVTETAVKMRRMGTEICSLVAAPLYHKNALQAIKQTLCAGGCFVLMKRFEARTYIEAIERYRCTLLTGVPTMFALLLQEDDLLAHCDLSSVTRIGFGSAPASDALYDRLQETFPQAEIENNYGITEGGPIMFGPHPEGLPRPRNSIGYPMKGAEVKLVGDQAPQEGVLHVRSPGVMLGYHNRPEETRTRMSGGYFDTGDILRIGEGGFYYFAGRSDDMFVTSGENIFPLEVETMLERHRDILAAAVVPVDDEIKGQVPHAFIVKADSSELDEEQVKQFARANGPPYAYPRRVRFVAALPLTGTNKIDRRALIDLACAGASQQEDIG